MSLRYGSHGSRGHVSTMAWSRGPHRAPMFMPIKTFYSILLDDDHPAIIQGLLQMLLIFFSLLFFFCFRFVFLCCFICLCLSMQQPLARYITHNFHRYLPRFIVCASLRVFVSLRQIFALSALFHRSHCFRLTL